MINRRQVAVSTIVFIFLLSASFSGSIDNTSAVYSPPPSVYEDITIRGDVRNEYGHPVVNVLVEIVDLDESINYNVYTDNTGRYSSSFTVIPDVDVIDANYRISVNREGYLPFSHGFDITGNTLNLDIELEKDGTSSVLIEGFVTQSGTNAPLQGVLVNLYPEDFQSTGIPQPYASSVTDEYGYYYVYTSYRTPANSFVQLSYSKSGIPTYSQNLPPMYGGDDYHFESVELSTVGYTTIYGQATGGIYDTELENAEVTVRRASTGEIVYQDYVGENAYFYENLPSYPGDYFVVEINATGYDEHLALVSADPGEQHYIDTTMPVNQESINEESWFNVILSQLKAAAWDALDGFLRNDSVIGSTTTFEAELEAEVFGAGLSLTLDVDITYSAAYEVTVDVLPGPFDGRMGTSLRVSLPPPLSALDAVFRFGMRLVIWDPDQDLQTTNPLISIESMDINAALSFQFEWNFEKLIDLISQSEDHESKSKMKQVQDKLFELGARAGLGIDLSFSIDIELGIQFSINEGELIDATNQDTLEPGLQVETLSVMPYLHIGIEADANFQFQMEIYVNEDLSFDLAQVDLAVSASTSIDYLPFRASYRFEDHRLQLEISRLIVDPPQVSVTYDWSVPIVGESGSDTLFDWSMGSPFDTGWWHTFEHIPEGYQNENTAPNAPSISGETDLTFPDEATVTISGIDIDTDRVYYEVNWGDGSSLVTSGYVDSGTPLDFSHSYSSAGDYTVSARAYDGEEWGNPSTLVISIYPEDPTAPVITGPSSKLVATYATFSAVADDPRDRSLRYIFYFGDGSSWTSGFVADGVSVSKSHKYSSTGTYTVRVVAENTNGNTNENTRSISITNNAPYRPGRPSGPSSGEVNSYLTFSFSTSDPNGHRVRYKIDWGDGSTTTTGYYSSGYTVSRSHRWVLQNIYMYVKVKAQDEYGAWSSWSYSKRVHIQAEDDGGGGCCIIMGTPVFPISMSTIKSSLVMNTIDNRLTRQLDQCKDLRQGRYRRRV